jgi:hypothetical protein
MYALNKIHSEAIIKLLHVSAPGCYHQGVFAHVAKRGNSNLSPSAYLFIFVPNAWIYSGCLQCVCVLFAHFARWCPQPLRIFHIPQCLLQFHPSDRLLLLLSPVVLPVRIPFYFHPLWVYTHISRTPCIPSLLHLTSLHPPLHLKTIVILLFEGEKCAYCRPQLVQT